MVIFVAIALGAFIVVAGAFLFGHDHDLGGDFDHDFSHDMGPDIHGIVGIFSTKVIFTFIMGFGAAGAIASSYGTGYPIASLVGIVAGIVLATLMYGIILLFTEQQSNSVIGVDSLLGCTGTVTVPIDKDAVGEIGVSVSGEYRTYAARLQGSSALPKGHAVRIVNVSGPVLTVDEDKGKNRITNGRRAIHEGATARSRRGWHGPDRVVDSADRNCLHRGGLGDGESLSEDPSGDEDQR